MGHNYEEGVKTAWKGFGLLLVVTLAEVFFALLGNGHISEGIKFPVFVMAPVMIAMSIYKAYFIIKEFMHLGGETRGMAASIILPVGLLFWAIIAFLWEGDAWFNYRDYVGQKNVEEVTVTDATLKPAKEVKTTVEGK